jgi:hypothetical protein
MAGNGDNLSEMLERDVREDRRSELHSIPESTLTHSVCTSACNVICNYLWLCAYCALPCNIHFHDFKKIQSRDAQFTNPKLYGT